MPQTSPSRPSYNPGGERGSMHSGSNSGRVPPSRPRTDAQIALSPGRAAHAASEARGRAAGEAAGRRSGMRTGVGVGAGIVGTAAVIKSAYDSQQADNKAFDAFNRGKTAGRQTDSAGRSTSPVGKKPKETYKSPMTKALMNDGRKPVMKPK